MHFLYLLNKNNNVKRKPTYVNYLHLIQTFFLQGPTLTQELLISPQLPLLWGPTIRAQQLMGETRAVTLVLVSINQRHLFLGGLENREGASTLGGVRATCGGHETRVWMGCVLHNSLLQVQRPSPGHTGALVSCGC